MARVLICEDNARVSDFVARGLAAEGHAVQVVPTLAAALAALRAARFELMLLDRMLPDGTGLDLCRRLRAEGHALPILMLTALDALEDKVAGLRAGADDYLAKPFAFEELLARVEALLRRGAAAGGAQAPGTDRDEDAAVLVVADLELDPGRKQVRRAGRDVALTAREYALLELLMRRPGRVFSRETILSRVWGLHEDPLTNVVEVYVRRLRAKIDEGHATALIRTVRGLGYRLDDSAGAG
jgi:DNA-binding response OmpR family regulator